MFMCDNIMPFKIGLLVDKTIIFCYIMRKIIITFVKAQATTMATDEKRKQRLKKEGTLHPNPDRVRTDLLAKSPFFDANDLMQMKYEMLRSVSADQQPVAEAAHTFGLSRVAYYHAQKQYRKHGLAGLLPRRRGPKHPHKFTPEVRSFIDEQLTATDRRPDWNLLSKKIEDRFGIKVHPRSVERAVKKKKGSEP
ncbi:MAG: helix-turn-helix domain-containing protein [Deltaproteobacteria bacterium]|nr:MAG: helix-turn-helix domain-containing protein [Deltaproteobacteria bacterium]